MTYEERIKAGWVIDICAECGRKATFPFCEHRSDTGPWTLPVAVKATYPAALLKLKP